MNLEYFITKRIALDKKNNFSSFIIMIATAAVALSLAVMIVATAILYGFNNEIERKIHGFWGHVQITSFDSNRSLENIKPISIDNNVYESLKESKDIKHVQIFAQKPTILKVDDEIEGIVLKGVSTDFDWTFFNNTLKEGETLALSDSTRSNDMMVSETTAKRMKLKVGDKALAYFVQQGQKRPKFRNFTVKGIYNTGLGEFDMAYAFIDIKHIQKLQKWDKTEVGGIELFVDDIDKVEKLTDDIYYNTLTPDMSAETIKATFPNIFDWLSMHEYTVFILIILMILVAGINMITALLILILERTNMVGILKAMGANNWSIRKVFLYNAGIIIFLGLIVGNVLGVGICWIQQTYELVKLPAESYYLSVAPVELNFPTIIALNIGTFVLCLTMLVIPSYLVSRITPIKAIRFK